MPSIRIRLASLCSIAIASFGTLSAEDVVEPARKQPIVRPPIAKPAPPGGQPIIAAPKWTMSIQEKPKFDEKQWGDVSESSTTKNLALTVQPELGEFAGNGPLAFRVTLKNDSPKPIVLAGGRLGAKPRLVLANQKTAAQWSLEMKESDESKPVTLAPGKAVSYTVTVTADQVFVMPPIPRPIPRPIPLPRPVPQPFPAQPAIGNGKAEALQVDRRRPVVPIRPPVVVGPVVPVGQGKIRARLFVEFEKTEAKPTAWTGRIASNPVEFEIGAPKPIVPPVVGAPTTKEQAVRVAVPAAERALQANYQPVAGIHPAHSGTWIDDPTKTANVTETKTGWRVAWTHTPKGKGFGYNVTVEVSRGGGAVVREVFTAYSPR